MKTVSAYPKVPLAIFKAYGLLLFSIGVSERCCCYFLFTCRKVFNMMANVTMDQNENRAVRDDPKWTYSKNVARKHFY